MNKGRLLAVADAIEKDSGQLFCMDSIGEPECGTPGCIAGWTVALFGPLPCSGTVSDRLNEARHYLDISDGEALRLFTPDEAIADCYTRDHADGSYIGSERAVAQLRYFAEHGRVDWRATP